MVDSDEEENNESFFENFMKKKTHMDPILLDGCSLFVIRDQAFNTDQPTIFPPSNHENLHHNHNNSRKFLSPSYGQKHATSPSSSSSSSSSSSDCFSPSDCNSPPSTPVKNESLCADVAECRWWNFGLRVLYAKVNGSLTYFRSFGSRQWVLSTFRSPAAVTAILLAFLYFRWWRRRQQLQRRPGVKFGKESNEQLLRVIKEKDERINQLLNQIARLNEVLLALHRVPSKTG